MEIVTCIGNSVICAGRTYLNMKVLSSFSTFDYYLQFVLYLYKPQMQILQENK